MTTLLSRLTLPGFGTYCDFYPAPLLRLGAYEAADYEDAAYTTTDYTEDSPLALGIETKLVAPLEDRVGAAR